jgi:23S rRNA (cytidine1920-2'-O)/16S rRNA (cytidine1409-2'-O)-methyltransferase
MIARAMVRTRLDAALVERGLFPTRARAQAAVLAGRVRVDGRPADKPGTTVADGSEIDVTAVQEYVSRGGYKLANALDALAVDVTGALALDLGASTGGFTDCLLQRGAAHVVALDVGYGQLDWKLRNDPRVTVLERTNARDLEPAMLPYAPDLVTCDLAFISVATVWPAVAPCLDPAYRALILVKPQFEVGRGRVGRGGVVRDPALRAEAVRRVAHAATEVGGRPAGVVDSGLPGPAGNREFFLLVHGPGRADPGLDLDAAIDRAVGDDGVA